MPKNHERRSHFETNQMTGAPVEQYGLAQASRPQVSMGDDDCAQSDISPIQVPTVASRLNEASHQDSEHNVAPLMPFQDDNDIQLFDISQLGPMGSDHAVQGIEAQSGHIQLRGLTHNMLNKCHDKAHCPVDGKEFTNNPFNYHETDEQYLKRKERQLASYIELLNEADSCAQPLDFMFLQEIDIFSKKLRADNAEQKRDNMVKAFSKMLTKLNWGVVKTTAAQDCKPMQILYNKNVLEFSSRRGLLRDSENRKNTAFEVMFKHKPSGKTVALTNVHLDYDMDSKSLSQEILNYLFAQSNSATFTIVGGDRNHPHEDFFGSLGPRDLSTSINAEQDSGKLTLRHRITGHVSTIDGFFVAPIGVNEKAVAQSHFCYYMNMNNGLKIEKVPSTLMTIDISPQNGWPVMSVEDYQRLLRRDSSQHDSIVKTGPGALIFTQSVNRPALPMSKDQVEATAAKPSIQDLLTAATFIYPSLAAGTKPLIRFEDEKFVIAIYYTNKDKSKQTSMGATSTLKQFAELIKRDYNLTENNGDRKTIKPYQKDKKSYFCIELSVSQVQELIRRTNTNSLKRAARR